MILKDAQFNVKGEEACAFRCGIGFEPKPTWVVGHGAPGGPWEEKSDQGQRPALRLKVHDTNVYSSGQLKRTKWYEVNRDDNYGYKQWDSHTSPWRYWRHLGLLMHSSSLRRVLFPNMFAIGCISAGVGYYNSVIAPATDSMLLSFPTMPLTLTGVGLSLLLVFRTNQSNARFDSARGCWGTVINRSRVLLRLSSTYIAKRDEQTYERVVRLFEKFSKNFALSFVRGWGLCGK